MRSGVPVTFTPTVAGSLPLTLTVNGLNLLNDDGTDDGTRPTQTLTITVA